VTRAREPIPGDLAYVEPLTIDCVCGVKAGEPCRRSGGELRTQTHMMRALIANRILTVCGHAGGSQDECDLCVHTGWRSTSIKERMGET